MSKLIAVLIALATGQAGIRLLDASKPRFYAHN